MTTYAEMHKDHKEWGQEHAAWIEDLDAWNHEYRRAMEDLNKLTEMLCQHAHELSEHARAIRNHEQVDVCHEHRLLRIEKDALDLSGQEAIHRKQTFSELELRDKHAHMKDRHHKMMAALAQIRKWINNPLD